MAPQAMVMNRNGHMGGALAGAIWTAGATISSRPPNAESTTPSANSAMAMTSWWELMKSRGCSRVPTGSVEAKNA